MKEPTISIVAAIQKQDQALGFKNKLLWHIPEDLKRFKRLTTGHPIIMGRKTYESIGRPLPQRINIVITRNIQYTAEGCLITSSLEQALEKAREFGQQEIFIIGGAEIYTQALPYTDKLYLTIVDDNQQGDVFFPDYSDFSNIISEENHHESIPPYSFITLEKQNSTP